jgi:hypothetical protein
MISQLLTYEMRCQHHALSTILIGVRPRRLFVSTRVCLEKADFFGEPAHAAELSILKAKSPWRLAHHLVEATAKVALIGESSCERDVNERKVCFHEQLFGTQ